MMAPLNLCLIRRSLPSRLASRHAAPTATMATRVSASRANFVTRTSPHLHSPSPPRPSPTKATTMLSHLINGNEQVRTQLDQTHSKQLAHDNSVTAFTYHHLRPGAAADYVDIWKRILVSKRAQGREAPESEPRFHASFLTLVGDMDTAVHITTFPSYADLELSLLQDAEQALPDMTSLCSTLRHRSNMVCREFGFWAPEDFHAMDGIYELRSYQLHPGKLLEWGQHWKKGVEARRQYTTPIGAWFSQLGPLHCVHHLWYYKNLQERQMSRERAWESEAWAKAVKLTVPLLTHLDAAILRRIG